MSVLPVGFGSALGGYQIERSLRFNSADSAYLNRTPASAGSTTLGTLSDWIKLGVISTDRMTYHVAGTSGNNNRFYITFNADNTFQIVGYNSSASIVLNLNTTQVFRDSSAWYHIVVAIDTTQATSSNRAKLYINGTQVTAFSTATYPSQNQALGFTNNTSTLIGSNQGVGNLFNGYITEVNFIDGQALTPSSFGETDANTGVWKPKAYTGTYGTNGFFLKFADNSNTTAATLGKDSSGNGNNWTPNNFSVTAGAGNDSLVDSPTSYGTDTGVGGEVRGNYCTFNAVNKSASALATLANGNLDFSGGGAGSFAMVYATIAPTSGKWYWEVTMNASGETYIGISDPKIYPDDNVPGAGRNVGFGTENGYSYGSNGNKYRNGTGTAYGATYSSGNIIGVAYDVDAGTLVFYKNNTSQGTAFTGISGGIYAPAVGGYTSNNVTINFGQRAFAYTAPSGFKALCTQNLPTPTIGATSTTQANDYFDVSIWTGADTGTGRSISGLQFAPDLWWGKSRSNSYYHQIFDAVRGAGSAKALASNDVGAEGIGNGSTYGYLSSFDPTGVTFTRGSAGSGTNPDGYAYYDELNTTYAAWAWNAGGSNATNTAGTITSTVRANTTSGFSIVTYTGNGTSGATVGHGLGVTPGIIIIKARTAAYNWAVWHTSLGGGNSALQLNSTNGTTTAFNYWNSTNPSSTVFTLGNDAGVNTNTNFQVAYCFAPVAGYSAFGSYTGNGSADGPFVFCGFEPRFVLVKCSSSAGEFWRIVDTARSPYNLSSGTMNELYPNSSSAESASAGIDILSNGFKIRQSGSGFNGSGVTYIYAAFAETPTKFSLAR